MPQPLELTTWFKKIQAASAACAAEPRAPVGHVESPAVNAMLAEVQASAATRAARQLAVMAEHAITEAPALAGRYGKAA
ncbi:hypothetical protein [Methylobacterium soli]|uniref:Uncharacterized protein n=1 Tax=Methylobacterium soli TaxID=553447 RepID=A0A6L3SRK0_9HYPH|nr:hypothetical protein [Methylobacterium soli]KAB1075426.1 hypothetical protein F6X53_25005 [Methylobacterium soli]GJE41324.1 hypothetical protein AEGHOMDF_0488 [Methylobacterium soli]